MKKEEARRILADASPECSFWVNNGPVLKSLEELHKALLKMNKETFEHHVTKEKNDFSAWIKDVLGDSSLAESLAKAKSKQAIITRISQRLQVLKRTAA